MTTTSASEAEAAPGYYGHPIVKAHVWKGYIGWYFFTGGLAGASSILAAAADLSGRPDLARHARRAALIGLVPSPALLVADLGRPKRFMNMLRVVKPTSPMSIGSWLLAVYGPGAAAAAVLDHVHVLPRVRRVSTVLAGTVGAAVATYTAVLVADTATPVWHEARNDLPPLFAASAGASGGAATAALAALSGRPSRAAGLIGAVGATTEIALSELMRRRLGDLDTY
ncbi:MAG: Polysulfide reductase, NrfD, partial [Acidimicrobiales bacterium]|nr:Polysulfide reductase, NrfD [Acidimicrobiales bacterium]